MSFEEFDLNTEGYEICKVNLQTDNNNNDFENITIILKNSQTGKIIQQYTVLKNETVHDFLVKSGTIYTVSVSDYKNEVYEYVTPAESEVMTVLENNIREINMIYNEKIVYLYNYGNMCSSITGVWDNNFEINNANKYQTVNPIFNTSNITLNLTNNSGIECKISTINMIDITNYSKIYINYEYDVMPAFSRPLCIFSDKSNFPVSYVAQLANSECANGISSIDIRDITGSYYIGSGIWNGTGSAGIENTRIIYQIWLEREN